MRKHKRLWDLYRFPGFSPEHTLSGIFGDPRARVIALKRRGKKRFVAPVVESTIPFYDRKIRWVRDLPCGEMRIYLAVEIRRVDCRRCGKVKQEKLDWLADYPFSTKRFAFYVGRRCRDSSIRDVAEEQRLDWRTVKALEMQYMQEQLRRAGTTVISQDVEGVDTWKLAN
jgi:hypothetical protein